MTEQARYQRLREELVGVIRNRVAAGNFRISPEEIGDVGASILGEDSDAVRRLTLREFFALAGSEWVGEVTPAEGPVIEVRRPPARELPPVLAILFDPAWFQRTGKASQTRRD